MATSFSGGRSQSTWWEPQTMGKQTDHGKLYHLRLRVECTLFVIYKAGLKLYTISTNLWYLLSKINHIIYYAPHNGAFKCCPYLSPFIMLQH
jgi:hypothetical protein